MKDLNRLRRTAAEITAAAVFEMFPGIEIWEVKEAAPGFICQLKFPHPVHPDTLPMIEEKIRQIVREKRTIKTLEMVAFSARELFKSQRRPFEADLLDGVEGLVELVQIGSFTNLSPGPHLSNTAELGAVKLLSIEEIEGKGVCITGAADFSKQELKDFLKKWDLYTERNHLIQGEREKLWISTPDGLVWLEQGLKLKSHIVQFLKKSLFDSAPSLVQEVAGPIKFEGDRFSLHAQIAKSIGHSQGCLGEVWKEFNEIREGEDGLFDSREETFVQITSFCPPEGWDRKLISSLQSISKMINILGFNDSLKLIGKRKNEKGFLGFQTALEMLGDRLGKTPQIELGGKTTEIDFLVKDGLGREWPAVKAGPITVKAISGKEEVLSGFFVAASVEKITALLIERNLSILSYEELMNMMVRL